MEKSEQVKKRVRERERREGGKEGVIDDLPSSPLNTSRHFSVFPIIRSTIKYSLTSTDHKGVHVHVKHTHGQTI